MATTKRIVTVSADEWSEDQAIRAVVTDLNEELAETSGDFKATRLTLTAKPSTWYGHADKLTARVILTRVR